VQSLTLIRPDDWHVHLRDGSSLPRTVSDMAQVMGRAIVMPNLTPPITTVNAAASYRERILAAMPSARQFDPLMVLYLTDQTRPDDIRAAQASAFVYAAKLYPAGATTNSDAGVGDLSGLYPVLAVMEEVGLPLLVHGEVTESEVDIFDREAVFIDQHMVPITQRFPALKIVFEHITTAQAAQFVTESPAHVGATITAHHLLLNRNDLLVGGIRPHHYCLPILKRRTHQEALIKAATSGDPSFFLGTDSAPHLQDTKEAACGCAGVYTAHAAIELYAEAFEQADALDKLENFASVFGPKFYGLEPNADTITLIKQSQSVPANLAMADSQLIPMRAGGEIAWSVVKESQ
jgi:dihydroorotase